MKKTVYWLAILLLFVTACSGKVQAKTSAKIPTPLETVQALKQTNLSVTHSELVPLDQYPPEIAAILKRGEIIFAMTKTDQSPFFFVEPKTGELIGLDVEIAYAIANKLGVRARFDREAAGFNDVVVRVANGQADVAISKLSRNFQRAQLVRYTKPYIIFRQGLLFNRIQLAKQTTEENLSSFIRDFSGSVGVIKGSYENYAKANFPNAKVVAFKDWEEAKTAVAKADVLVIYRDEFEILKILAEKKDALLTLKPVVLTDKQDPIAMAVAWNAPILQQWLDIFLDDYVLTHSDELSAQGLINRYYPSNEENK